MGKSVKRQDLLYVSNGDGVVNVYRYWQHTLVGVLSKFTTPMGECTDAAGDVYIVDQNTSKISEYAHGGSKAIKRLDDSPYTPQSCAVNQSTGDLAVANYGGYSDKAGNIAVYLRGTGKPVLYTAATNDHFIACGYDRRGDLLAADYSGFSDYYYGYFYYLPKHGVKLLLMNLPGPSRSWAWDRVESVFWDGQYWVVGAYDTLYRYTINVKASYISSTQLNPGDFYVNQVAMYKPIVKSHSAQVVGAAESSNSSAVDYWNYPAGGIPVGQITKGLDRAYGIAISLGAQ